MKNHSPNRITFQWHITDVCNFRCKHCYQDDFSSNGLGFNELQIILLQLQEFAKYKGISRAHINLTGGEPFLRDDLIPLLHSIKETGVFSFGILSNGYLPSNRILKDLKFLEPRFVQISLEGKKETNDIIRGIGSYEKILDSLKVYRKLRIPAMISFTANTENYTDYPHVVKIARKYKAFKIWTDRYLPNGKADNLQLTTEQFKKLGDLINTEKRKGKYNFFSKTEIAANRALQFLFSGGLPYKCSAGDSLLAILSNGDILPCRRLPVRIGNLLTGNLIELYDKSDILNDIRKDNLDIHCSDCYYKRSCNGGLKCLSYKSTGDYNIKDINCWI